MESNLFKPRRLNNRKPEEIITLIHYDYDKSGKLRKIYKYNREGKLVEFMNYDER